MSNSSFTVANKWFLKISSTVWRSEGFQHGEQRFPSTGRPLIWRLHQHITVFSDPMSVINVYLPSGLALGFFRPPSCINSKAKATLWTWGSRKQHSRIDMLARFRVSQRCIHLLFEALGGEEEVVQRDKIILKQPHQQHQVDTVGKLRKQTDNALTTSVTLFKDPNEIQSRGSSSYLRFQLCHFQVQLVQVFVDEGDERLETQLALVMSRPHVSSVR